MDRLSNLEWLLRSVRLICVSCICHFTSLVFNVNFPTAKVGRLLLVFLPPPSAPPPVNQDIREAFQRPWELVKLNRIFFLAGEFTTGLFRLSCRCSVSQTVEGLEECWRFWKLGLYWNQTCCTRASRPLFSHVSLVPRSLNLHLSGASFNADCRSLRSAATLTQTWRQLWLLSVTSFFQLCLRARSSNIRLEDLSLSKSTLVAHLFLISPKIEEQAYLEEEQHTSNRPPCFYTC